MLSGLILAGGRSSRMGCDKASLVLPGGRSLLERQAEVLRSAGAGARFASVRSGSTYHLSGVDFVHDEFPDAGPLAGIAAGLKAAQSGLVITLAVDMAGIEVTHLQTLLANVTEHRGVVPLVNGQLEPLAAVYPAALAGSAALAASSGNRAVHAWVRREAGLGRLLIWTAPSDWAGAFRNWNTPEDIPPQG